tara:strand:+ start:450 stop:656 length:207 start_codon:yes stop_codon:yes gene_type:complete
LATLGRRRKGGQSVIGPGHFRKSFDSLKGEEKGVSAPAHPDTYDEGKMSQSLGVRNKILYHLKVCFNF